jgi:hypothetical protein
LDTIPVVPLDEPPAIELSGFLLGGLSQARHRRNDLSSEAAVITQLDHAVGPGTARIRTRASIAHDATADRARLELLEGSYLWHYRDYTINMGKTILNWDTGLSFQPVGFFQNERDLADLGDFEGRAQGIPLIAVTRALQSFDVTAAFSDRLEGPENDVRRSRRQGAIRLAADIGPLTTGWIVHAAEDRPLGGALTVSATVTERLVIHGSAYADERSFRSIAGWSIIAPWPGTIIVEWARERGSDAEGPTSQPLANGTRLRRDVAFIQASAEMGRLSLSAGTQFDIAEASASATTTIIWRTSPRLEIRGLALRFFGSDRTQVTSSISDLLRLTLRFAF